MKLRYMIIDDEYLARQRLLKLLEPNETMLCVGECRNGQDALIKIPIKEPDLIFLDIQMPDLNGFQVLSKLAVKPHVIFTTAYDQYALKAFEINAVDYLLKPFDEDRLEESLSRILSLRAQQKASHFEKRLKNLMRSYTTESSVYLTEIPIKEQGRIHYLSIDDIIYFKSDGNYVKLETQTRSFLHRTTMNQVYQELNTSQFLRVHRSIIINKLYIKKCSYVGNNAYRFQLKTDETIESSRSYKSIIDDYLNHQ